MLVVVDVLCTYLHGCIMTLLSTSEYNYLAGKFWKIEIKLRKETQFLGENAQSITNRAENLSFQDCLLRPK